MELHHPDSNSSTGGDSGNSNINMERIERDRRRDAEVSLAHTLEG